MPGMNIRVVLTCMDRMRMVRMVNSRFLCMVVSKIIYIF